MWDIDTLKHINREGSDYQPEKPYTGITATNEVRNCMARTEQEARTKLGDVAVLIEGNVKSVSITHWGTRSVS
jgi:hypothetical protein